MSTFQDIILNLQKFWTSKGCILQQSHDLQTGAGTFHPETFLRALGPEPYNVCHVEISRRPTDGRYGQNPNRLQRFHQFQVMMKPTPQNMQQLYLESLEAIGFDLSQHDIRFVHDDWESPTQGAAGLGWEVWCDGMEITQFTYFQQIGGIALSEIPAELAYGIERIALFLQKKENVYDLDYNETLSYGDVFLDLEKQYSKYNFEDADVEMWRAKFDGCEAESKALVEKQMPGPAYDMAVEASHAFNMLDARGAISVTARVSMIHRVRDLCCAAAKCHLEHREKEGFLLLKESLEEDALPLSPVKETGDLEEDFLLEVGSEHLPANAIPSAAISLESEVKAFFAEYGLNFKEIEVIATPKRLGLFVHGLDAYTKEEEVEKKGPALSLAFEENGEISKQGAGFFRSTGESVSSKEEMEKNSAFQIRDGRIVHLSKKEKIFVGKLLQHHLPALIAKIRFPKKMRWTPKSYNYARPVRSVLVLFGKQLIDVEICGVRSSREVSLNLQQQEGKASISKPSEYFSKLEKGKVLALPSKREESIKEQLEKICTEQKTSVLHLDAVMKEVLFLTENPILAVGSFDDRFLTLPEELIISEMVDHQKYFPMREQDGKISTKFVVVVDKAPTEMMMENYGNVLIARLSDGLFLYEKDLRGNFDAWNAMLEQVVHHPKLGSVYNKVERIMSLAEKLAALTGMHYEKHAAKYCKADLVSDVVFEFPELQGTMGKYYALQFGESEKVALAIEEHYMPKSEGAEIPTTQTGTIVALADRLDNLLSYMGIGLMPTSSKDPYALRRAAVGINRILIENKISLNLKEVVQEQKIADFIIQRIGPMLKEYGFAARDIEMCGIYDSCDPYKIYKCVEAIAHIRGSKEEFSRLVEIHKRIKGSVGEGKEEEFSEKSLQEPAEKALSTMLKKLQGEFHKHIEQGEFEAAFGSLSELVEPLESFFETVRVNIDDAALQKNRRALLTIPYKLMTSSLNF